MKFEINNENFKNNEITNVPINHILLEPLDDIFNLIGPYGGNIGGSFALELYINQLLLNGNTYRIINKIKTFESNDIDVYFKSKEGYLSFIDNVMNSKNANYPLGKFSTYKIDIPESIYEKNNDISHSDSSFKSSVSDINITEYYKWLLDTYKQHITLHKKIDIDDFDDYLTELSWRSIDTESSYLFISYLYKILNRDPVKSESRKDLFYNIFKNINMLGSSFEEFEKSFVFNCKYKNKNIQLIKPIIDGHKILVGPIENIVKNFDLNICCIGIDIQNKCFAITDNANVIRTLQSGSILFKRLHNNPTLTFRRILKYTNRGFNVNDMEMYRFFFSVSEFLDEHKNEMAKVLLEDSIVNRQLIYDKININEAASFSYDSIIYSNSNLNDLKYNQIE